jgi:Kef-type K+ transport system membrane component KefB
VDNTARSLVVIFSVAALAPLVADRLRAVARVPSVVLEIGLGIVVGPAVLGWARDDSGVTLLAALGLNTLMFLAGYEIEFSRIRGAPLRLAVRGWGVSLVLAAVVAWTLNAASLTESIGIVALALTTTAIGTILPILQDAHETQTQLGRFILAAGAVGEFGPIVAISVFLSAERPGRAIAALILFLGLAAVGVILAMRPRLARVQRLISATLGTSAQLAVRIAVLLLVLMVWIAAVLDLDALLGAFAAGIVYRQFISYTPEHEVRDVEHRLQALGYGFLIPLFFVVSGIRFDLHSLVSDFGNVLLLPVFLVGFLIVRGIPALWLYRRELPAHERRALALFTSTALPLVVVITGIGVANGDMDPGTAAAFVGAGMLSVLLFPSSALRLRATEDVQPHAE